VRIKISRPTNLKENIASKVKGCLFLGYEDNYSGNACQVLDLRNKTMMIRRDGRCWGRPDLADTDAGRLEDELEDERILKPWKGPSPVKKSSPYLL
jgi:hypothetical protein